MLITSIVERWSELVVGFVSSVAWCFISGVQNYANEGSKATCNTRKKSLHQKLGDFDPFFREYLRNLLSTRRSNYINSCNNIRESGHEVSVDAPTTHSNKRDDRNLDSDRLSSEKDDVETLVI